MAAAEGGPLPQVAWSISGRFPDDFRSLCGRVWESGPGDRPWGLRNDVSYLKGLEFASKNKKWQGLAKNIVFLIVIPGVYLIRSESIPESR